MGTIFATTSGIMSAGEEELAQGSTCSGSLAIHSPTNSAVEVGWDLDATGNVTGIRITWAPDDSSDYLLVAAAEGSYGSLAVSDSGTDWREDVVTLSKIISPESTSAVTVSIADQGPAPMGPATALGWGINGEGQVSAGVVTWTPEEDGAYLLEIAVGDSNGITLVAESGTARRSDTVVLVPPVAAHSATTATLCIEPV